MGLIDRIHHLRSLLPPTHPSLPPTPIAPHIIARRRAPFIPPIQNPYRAPSELTPEERDQLDAWNEGSAAPEFDERMYEVAVWARAWDGGTGLPIPGMGLMKPGMKGFGSGGGGGGGGSGGKRGKGGDDDDEYESDDDM
ncbi:hypothetical protein DL93DRAFT_2080956 [Clavulina sp. PMI_390]|nr:hypothetical protein DL93DRAFT_2080956 [Clavulina sp. PMI_390]